MLVHFDQRLRWTGQDMKRNIYIVTVKYQHKLFRLEKNKNKF